MQIVRFVEMTPTPFIRAWLDDGRDIIFDIDGQSRVTILQRLAKTLGKTDKMLETEAAIKSSMESKDNPAIFGWNHPRFCMCEIPGQVPCSGVVEIPKSMQGKYTKVKPEEYEEWEKKYLDGEVEWDPAVPWSDPVLDWRRREDGHFPWPQHKTWWPVKDSKGE